MFHILVREKKGINGSGFSFFHKLIYTQTPCGFLLVGTAVSSCRGEPIIRRVLPGRWEP